MTLVFLFQLDDLKVVKLLICTAEHSVTLKKAANKSKFASNNDVRIVSLGEAEGCENLFKLLEEVDGSDVIDPVQINDVSTENLIVFWSSGTTGNNNNLNIVLTKIFRNIYKPIVFS